MTGATLFAGLDSDGNVQFVGDVERGLAANCFCATCKSPLLAKKGDVREWHFAHVGNQERPECLVGAMNLLRRIAIEQLAERPNLVFPFYKRQVHELLGAHSLSETVEWLASSVERIQWDFEPAKDDAAARIELTDGVRLALYVDVSQARPRQERRALGEEGLAEAVYWMPPPAPGELVTSEAAITFVRAKGEFHWLHHPDRTDLVDGARARLRQRLQALRQASGQWERDRAHLAGQRWAGIRAGMQTRLPPTPGGTAPAAPNMSPGPVETPAWWIWRKPNSSMLFYGLTDGSGWLIVQHLDGRSVLVPWPRPDEGWDEAFPARVGTADSDLQGVVARDLTGAMMYLRDLVKLTRNGSTLEFLGTIPWPPADGD